MKRSLEENSLRWGCSRYFSPVPSWSHISQAILLDWHLVDFLPSTPSHETAKISQINTETSTYHIHLYICAPSCPPELHHCSHGKCLKPQQEAHSWIQQLSCSIFRNKHPRKSYQMVFYPSREPKAQRFGNVTRVGDICGGHVQVPEAEGFPSLREIHALGPGVRKEHFLMLGKIETTTLELQ